MALGNVKVVLNLDTSDFDDGIDNAVDQISQFKKRIAASDAALIRNQGILRNWGRSIKTSVTELYSLTNLLSPITNGIKSVSTGFIRANAEFEKTTAVLSSLNNEVGLASDKMIKTARSIDYLNQTAKQTPFTISSIQRAMVKFSAGGLDPVDGSLQSLIDSVAKFGGSATELDRASVAIQQMAGKGVVSMEELRQQLGEAVPNAMQLMASGLRLSMSELAKLVESGTLKATGALRAMFAQMELQNGGAAKDMMSTWDGIMSQITNRVNVIYRELGDTGLFDVLKEQAKLFLDLLNSPETLNSLKSMAESLGTIITYVSEAVRYIDDLNVAAGILMSLLAGKAISSFVKSLGSIKAGASIAKASLVGMGTAIQGAVSSSVQYRKETKSLNRFIKEQAGNYGVAYQKAIDMSIAQKRLKIETLAMNGVMATSARVMQSVGRASLSLLGPIGAGIGIVLELANAFDLFGTKADEMRARAAEGTELLSAEEFTKVSKGLADANEELTKLKTKLSEAQTEQAKFAKGSGGYNRLLGDIRAVEYEINKTQTTIKSGQAIITKQTSMLANATATAFEQQYAQQVRAASRKVTAEYQSTIKKINAEREASKGDKTFEKELTERQNAEDTAFIKRLAAVKRNEAKIAYEGQKAIALSEESGSSARNLKLQALEDSYKILIATIADEEAKMIKTQQTIRENGVQVLNKDADFWTEAYKKSYIQLAAETARLTGENVAYAKSVAKNTLNAQKDLQVSREQAEQKANQVQNIKALISANKELDAIDAKIEKSQAGIAASNLQVEETNPWLKITAAQKGYIKSIELSKTKAEENAAAFGKFSEQAKRASEQASTFGTLLSQQQAIDLTSSVNQMDKMTKSINAQYASQSELMRIRTEEHNKNKKNLEEMVVAVQNLTNVDETSKTKMIASIEKYGEALDTQFKQKNMTAVQTTLSEWGNLSKQMDNMWSGVMTDMSSSLADFVMTGKLDFESLTNSIMKSIIQIGIQAAASQIFGSVFGVSASGGTALAGTPNTGGASVASLDNYANSGIAPASFSEAMRMSSVEPSPDIMGVEKTGSMPNVSVNVINETGSQVDAEQQGSMKFDGEKYVLDVVMKAMNRPGNFRTAMKGSTRQ